MAKIDELKVEAEKLNIPLTGEETKPQIEALIKAASPEKDKSTKNPSVDTTQERSIPISEVKKLIAEALANQAEDNQPKKVKRVTEHHAHVWRIDGQWVVDFADKNFDYAKNEVIDPYIKEKVHAFNRYNEQKREFEAWITLILEDGTKKEMPLNRYVQHRTLVYCTIVNRKKVDKSYVIGEVERKKEVGDVNVGTGIMVDQEVELYTEIFVIRTPEGKVLELPDYVIC